MKIAPSILAADFANLSKDIRDVVAGGADWIHVDVMDGHFVPNITFGPSMVEAIRPITDLPLDVHLMIEDPAKYLDAFAKAGADYITVHAEADRHLHRTLQEIRKLGAKSGVALNPGTPIGAIEHVLDETDLVLIMTVNPGFGGQSFIQSALNKISETRNLLDKRGIPALLEVDGGITAETAKLCKEAGANVFVAGSSIYGETDREEAISRIRSQLG
ncbi:MAG TPA: ribulose-phosphate 3-epimerase [Bacillaceae bacterium]